MNMTSTKTTFEDYIKYNLTHNTTGTRIRQLREALGLSQDDLAMLLNYKSRSSINKIELGERNLTQSKIKAIADALHTTPAYIMGWEDPLESVDPDIMGKVLTDTVMTEHVQRLYGLTHDHRCQVYDLIDILHDREQSGTNVRWERSGTASTTKPDGK
jgi:transcriptional regulator with XRE-family HTH domain